MNSVQLKLEYEPNAVELSFSFIDRFMLKCPPVYSLVYIYCLKQCALGQDVSACDVARLFNVLETDVNNAWVFWEKEGLIKSSGKGESTSLTFLPVPASGEPEVKSAEPAARITERPQYTVEELAVYRKQSKDISSLFAHAEQALGKLLTYHDMNVLFGFYDWLRLPADVIKYLLTYCADNGHRDLRYIERAALDWVENEIDDIEKAFVYVQTFDRGYREILRAMGQFSGYPTPSQKKYMNKWLREFNMPSEMILEACDRAGLQIGKPKFTYVDKILTDWNKKGIRTLKDAEADSAEHSAKKTQTETAVAPRKRNRFANFKQSYMDQAKLEKMEQDYLEQSLRG